MESYTNVVEDGKLAPEVHNLENITPEQMSALEAYRRGRHEELSLRWDDLKKLLETQIWHSQTASLTRGSIGAGSTVVYGLDPEPVGVALGLVSAIIGIASFFLFEPAVTVGAFATTGGSLVIGLWPRFIKRRGWVR